MSQGRPTTPPVPPSVFLERQSYRRRRLMDAARLMPVLGALVFAVPLMWPMGQDGAADEAGDVVAMSSAILYIFVAWAGLIALSALFGLGARRWGESDAPRDDARDSGPG